MKKSTENVHDIQQLQSHPLFSDCEFVPLDQNHVLLQTESKCLKGVSIEINVPFGSSQNITIEEIEQRSLSKIDLRSQEYCGIVSPKEFTQSQIYSFQDGEVVQESKKKDKSLIFSDEKSESISSFKKKMGKKEETIEKFKSVPNTKSFEGIKVQKVKNLEKYEVCIIPMSKMTDVFTVPLHWQKNIKVLENLRQIICSRYDCKLSQEDIKYSNLTVYLEHDKEIFSFRFQPTWIKSEEEIQDIVFGHSKPVYIGIQIISSKFQSTKPRIPLMGQNGINVVAMHKSFNHGPVLSIIQPHFEPQRYLVIQFQDYIGMRVDYNAVKEYKVKFLLGNFKVTNCHKKGLMVLGRIYKPDDYVKSFKHAFKIQSNSDVNFIHGKVTSERELFLSEMLDEADISAPEMMSHIDYNGLHHEKMPCLSAYVNQGLFPKDNNEPQRYIVNIIRDFITNYYIQNHFFEQNSWKRYIKTMLKEIQSLKVHRGWVYRIVNYVYDRKINDVVRFNNFILTTRREDKVRLKLQFGPKERSTVFKIKSTSGRAIEKISAFMLDEVVFLPYSSFQIIRKEETPSHIEYVLEEIEPVTTVSRFNLLIWVDDKMGEGKTVYNIIKNSNIPYPIYLFQLSSTRAFSQLVEKNKAIFSNANAKKIVISNMTRKEGGQLNEKAGVSVFKLAKELFSQQNQFIFYIGNKEGTVQKLQENGVKGDECMVTNDTNELICKLIQLCNWGDIEKTAENPSSDVLGTPNENWGNVFSTLKKVNQSPII